MIFSTPGQVSVRSPVVQHGPSKATSGFLVTLAIKRPVTNVRKCKKKLISDSKNCSVSASASTEFVIHIVEATIRT